MDTTPYKLIIHISGPSGSGKTTLGNQLKQIFGDKIVVTDLDDLRNEFLSIQSYFTTERFQEYIYSFIAKQTTPIIFTGINTKQEVLTNPFKTQECYDLESTYTFCILINLDVLYKRRFERFFSFSMENKDFIISQMMSNEEEAMSFLKSDLQKQCSFNETKKIHEFITQLYLKKKYTFLSYDDLYYKIYDIIYSLN